MAALKILRNSKRIWIWPSIIFYCSSSFAFSCSVSFTRRLSRSVQIQQSPQSATIRDVATEVLDGTISDELHNGTLLTTRPQRQQSKVSCPALQTKAESLRVGKKNTMERLPWKVLYWTSLQITQVWFVYRLTTFHQSARKIMLPSLARKVIAAYLRAVHARRDVILLHVQELWLCCVVLWPSLRDVCFPLRTLL